MSCTVAVLAPMFGSADDPGFNLDLVIRYGPSRRQLTLRALYEAACRGFEELDRPLPGADAYAETIPASGYYLAGLLRANGYEVLLASKDDEDELRRLAKAGPRVLCISSSMLFSAASLRSLVKRARVHMPDVFIIVGGIHIWKSFCWYEMNHGRDLGQQPRRPGLPGSGLTSAGQPRDAASAAGSRWSTFPCSRHEVAVDAFVVSPHGASQLLELLEAVDRGRAADLGAISNLALPGPGGQFVFTRRQDEQPDYDHDYTRWDLIDPLPARIPIRTSVGCPYRCAYCDFCTVFPNLYLRSADSIQEELSLIRKVLRERRQRSLLSFVDDNAFSSASRIRELCAAVEGSRIATYWLGFVHTRHIDASNIDLIRRSGLILAMIGIESGDPDQLGRMGRSRDIERARRAVELLDSSGITPLMYFVLGFPGETEVSLGRTAGFLNQLDLHGSSASYQMYRLQVLPMSRLGQGKLRRQHRLEGMWSDWSHSTMSSTQTEAAGRMIFDQVTDVPYHYEDESAAFNRRFATQDQRALFNLRNQLTRQLLDEAACSQICTTLTRMTRVMGLGSTAPPIELVRSLSVGNTRPLTADTAAGSEAS